MFFRLQFDGGIEPSETIYNAFISSLIEKIKYRNILITGGFQFFYQCAQDAIIVIREPKL